MNFKTFLESNLSKDRRLVKALNEPIMQTKSFIKSVHFAISEFKI